MAAASRMTKQRALILEELKALKTHPTADELYTLVRAKMPNISLGTVYRNLDLLAENKEILRLDYAGHQKRFDANTYEHQHVRCLTCGKMRDVEVNVDLPSSVKEMQVDDFDVQFARLEFFGECTSCKKRAKSKLN